ncbi:hypothetical protein KSS87_007216 [Heliosperma pusillum]|nr:hypothetical protein KSS87_007216 [Heliosperma pusillum]
MADFKKLNWMGARLKPTSRMTYEDIDPGTGWANDPESPFHQLLLDLPGFKKSDIKLQVDDSGNITISGERRVSEYKRARFRKKLKAPEDSDTEKISMQFEGVTLEVSIPRVAKKMKEEPQIKNGASSSKDVKEEHEKKVQNVMSSSELRDDKRQESESTKEAEKNKSEPVIRNEALSSDLREAKAAQSESFKDENEKEEPENKNGAPSSDLREEKGEEFGSLEETKETKEEPKIKNEGSSNDIREEKREEFESSEEAKEMKEESKFNNGVLSKDIREESERSNDSKVTEEKSVIEKGVPSETKEESERSNQTKVTEKKTVIEKEVLSEKREEYESSKETKENKEDPESKIGALRSELIREEKKEESENAKVAKENGEPETENRAFSSELLREGKRDESGNCKEENVEKPDIKNGKELKNGHLIKGNNDSGHGNTSEDSVMEKIIKNRGILLASLISFTLGVLVSQKFHKPPSK